MKSVIERENLSDGVVQLSIRNDNAANALTDELLAFLRQQLLDIDKQLEHRCILLRGHGGTVFSSGYDTSQLQTERFRQRPDPIGPVCVAIRSGRVPVIACLNGHCFGGAVEIAASCDLRIGQIGSKLGIPAVRFGICYAPAGVARLSAALGSQLATELLLTGEPISFERCLRAGFVTELVCAEKIDDTAFKLATQITSAAPLAVEAMRRCLHHAATPLISTEQHAQLKALFEACLESDDLDRGLATLRSKQKAVFQRD